MIIKYVRVSTLQQNEESQLTNKIKFDKIIIDKVSGSIAFDDRPGGKEIINLCLTNHINEIHIKDVSRLGRNFYDIFKTINFLNEQKIILFVENLKLYSIIDKKPNPIFNIIISLLATIAEQEKQTLIERVTTGRQLAKLKGVKFGRRTGSIEERNKFLKKPKAVKVINLIQNTKKKYTQKEVCQMVNVSFTFVNKVLNYLNPDRQKYTKIDKSIH